MIKVSELRQRDVINVVDGRRLGFIKDVELDVAEGKIKALVLPGQGGKFLFFFGHNEDLVIPWEKVIKVGIDVILVENPSVVAPKHLKRT
ncbi:MAG: YlmC/YmxH family sporulation protein [Thermanaeromonas sp.]|uniref:YlmC/YmxH family sporulation protein n=1 Tax=Thermanaeromonas sp. TaxID=2003697 RepID=UPI00243F3235|nr:YlmC/YmxH family sporulation protein [Thermanaeromonas sp.]MCG0276974.1 YlmC/YmxH family sporulation protein [Thermanaeromonas sp.]